MKKGYAFSAMFCALSLFVLQAFGQETSNYNPHETFDPTFISEPGTAYRSGSGQPGPAYWQNRASYKISADLNESDATVTAQEVISYKNNSPDALPYLWRCWRRSIKASRTCWPT